MSHSRLLLKLALGACERGDADGAAEVLRAVLAVDTPALAAASTSPRAVSVAELAPIVGYSARHLRGLIERGAIPADAVLGRGRGRRVFVEAAIDALRLSASYEPPATDPIERDGAEHAGRARQRRGRQC